MIISGANLTTQVRVNAYTDAIPDLLTRKIDKNQRVNLVDLNTPLRMAHV